MRVCVRLLALARVECVLVQRECVCVCMSLTLHGAGKGGRNNILPALTPHRRLRSAPTGSGPENGSSRIEYPTALKMQFIDPLVDIKLRKAIYFNNLLIVCGFPMIVYAI